jgi:hypothetical protein
MSTIEFQTKIKNGTIELPDAYRGRVTGSVRVIVFHQEPKAANPHNTFLRSITGMFNSGHQDTSTNVHGVIREFLTKRHAERGI